MSIFSYLSNDLISHICSTYILVPCLDKHIYEVCKNSCYFRTAKRKALDNNIKAFFLKIKEQNLILY